MDEIARVFSDQGAQRKVTPEIERYALDRYHELFGQEKSYNQIIRQDIERYFKVTLSADRLRQIFATERAAVTTLPENPASLPEDEPSEDSGEVSVAVGAYDCQSSVKQHVLCRHKQPRTE